MKIIKLKLKNYDTFQVLFQNEDYAIIFKPANMPTAPLRENEKNVALNEFLKDCPAAKTVKSKKKEIEYGLLHRLDTATSGLVLIAKQQSAYDALYSLQENARFKKEYFAFCDGRNFDKNLKATFEIKTMFRAFGPKGRKVKSILPDSPEAKRLKARIYTTTLISIQNFNTKKTNEKSLFGVRVELSRGYRHQVRKHLSTVGLAILGDELYNEHCMHRRLQLFATALRFPDIRSKSYEDEITYSIPAPKNVLE